MISVITDYSNKKNRSQNFVIIEGYRFARFAFNAKMSKDDDITPPLDLAELDASIAQATESLKEMRKIATDLRRMQRETTRDLRAAILDKAAKGKLPKSKAAAKPMTIVTPVPVTESSGVANVAKKPTKALAKSRSKKTVVASDESVNDPSTAVTDDFADFAGCATGTLMTEKQALAVIAKYVDENMLVSEVSSGNIVLDRRLKVLLGLTSHHDPHATYFLIRQHIGKAFVV